jgi:hypothetical protein
LHCQPGKQVCIGSQIWPGKQVVPAVGVGGVPGVHCQPAWHICPALQMSPGMQIAEVRSRRRQSSSGERGEPGGVVGVATQPVSSKKRGQ